jgi:hypothetical protein
MSGIIGKRESRGSGNITTIGGFPSGTKMLFHQTAAPTGWTKLSVTGSGDTGINDVGLRIVTGTITDGLGGSVAFDTAFASVTPTITMTNDPHTLATSEMPSHTHTAGWSGWSAQDAGRAANREVRQGGQTTDYGTPNTGPTGGGGTHTHTNSAASSAINLDVKYVDMIIASKD